MVNIREIMFPDGLTDSINELTHFKFEINRAVKFALRAAEGALFLGDEVACQWILDSIKPEIEKTFSEIAENKDPIPFLQYSILKEFGTFNLGDNNGAFIKAAQSAFPILKNNTALYRTLEMRDFKYNKVNYEYNQKAWLSRDKMEAILFNGLYTKDEFPVASTFDLKTIASKIRLSPLSRLKFIAAGKDDASLMSQLTFDDAPDHFDALCNALKAKLYGALKVKNKLMLNHALTLIDGDINALVLPSTHTTLSEIKATQTIKDLSVIASRALTVIRRTDQKLVEFENLSETYFSRLERASFPALPGEEDASIFKASLIEVFSTLQHHTLVARSSYKRLNELLSDTDIKQSVMDCESLRRTIRMLIMSINNDFDANTMGISAPFVAEVIYDSIEKGDINLFPNINPELALEILQNHSVKLEHVENLVNVRRILNFKKIKTDNSVSVNGELLGKTLSAAELQHPGFSTTIQKNSYFKNMANIEKKEILTFFDQEYARALSRKLETPTMNDAENQNVDMTFLQGVAL